ncbi:multiheme c-type cytochrome [Shewanella algae]
MIDQQQACYRCHDSDSDKRGKSEARLLMHGSKRFAFEGCVMCHTSYSGDPETGSALDMATLTHQIHQGEYKVIGYQGHEYDYSQLHYPGDIKDCNSCHIPDAAPQANQYFIPGSNSCLSCHSKDAPMAGMALPVHYSTIENSSPEAGNRAAQAAIRMPATQRGG